MMRCSRWRILRALSAVFVAALGFGGAGTLAGCSKPEYDTASPQAALDSMYQMIADGRADMLADMIHIEPRDIAYDDGVTEASAIQDVKTKAGEMLGQLYRVANKLRERYPDQIDQELVTATAGSRRTGLDFLTRFLTDPFGLMDEQRSRITVEDLGDGTAAVLIDGKPAFGLGLQMKDIDGKWRVNVPIHLLQEYRPNTRHEWSVIASMMLAMENSLTAFETELDDGQFRDLKQASARAGRLLGERVFVQAVIYQNMKQNAAAQADAASGKDQSKPG
jgi:hypothetical protein